MKTPLLLIALLFGLARVASAQDSLVHPYVGASFNVGGVELCGWGVEGGARYRVYYLGAEYGAYGGPSGDIGSGSRPAPTTETDEPTTHETYVGVHGGVIFFNMFGLDIVVLRSAQSVNHYALSGDSTNGFPNFNVAPAHRVWLNVGLEFRLVGLGPWMFDLAYTERRGIKLGLAYKF